MAEQTAQLLKSQVIAGLPEAEKIRHFEAEQARKERAEIDLGRNRMILAAVVLIGAAIWIVSSLISQWKLSPPHF